MMGLTTRSEKVKELYKDEPFSFMLEHKKTLIATIFSREAISLDM